MSDPIFALATAPGRAAVAVVRLSGPGSREALRRLGAGDLRPRRASLRTLRDREGVLLDRALALWFPAPHSYTGEDCAELHLHGGAAVVEAVMGALAAQGLRLAQPGEFTRRAFENGKLDLDQAEAVADLVDAETSGQARQALAQLRGALGRRYHHWRETLVDILANLEAAVDFPDEEIPAEVEARAREPIEGLIADLDLALRDGQRGRRVRDGYRVAIVGATNAGKSTLLNALAGRELAIVTPVAGATRDIIETPLIIAGYQVILADMAGLRRAADPVEAEGVRRARAWATDADRRLWVVDRASDDDSWAMAAESMRPGDLCVVNKTDLVETACGAAATAAAASLGLERLGLSLVTDGPEPVRRWLMTTVSRELGGADFPATTRLRHERRLSEAREHLRRAAKAIGEPELAAEDVRLALRSLAMVTGAIGVEDVLDQVFASFCIGK